MKIERIIAILGLVLVLGVGGYFGYKAYAKHVFVDSCVDSFMAEHQSAMVTPERRDENLKFATQFCGCTYDKMEQGMPRFMAELGCMFGMMLE